MPDNKLTNFENFVVSIVFIGVLVYGLYLLDRLPEESKAADTTMLGFYIPLAAGGAAALTAWLFRVRK